MKTVHPRDLHNPSYKDRAEWERTLYPWTAFFDAVGCEWEPSDVLGASIYIPHLQLTFTAIPLAWGGNDIAHWADEHSRSFCDAFAFALGYPNEETRVHWYGYDLNDSSGGCGDDVGYWQYCKGNGLTLYLPMMRRDDRFIVTEAWDTIEAYEWFRDSEIDSTRIQQGIRASFQAFTNIRSKDVRHALRVSPQRKAHKNSKGLSLRFRIFKRDNYRCQLCGATAQDGVRLEMDHKVPRAKGGTDDESNLWTLCFECNRGKRDNYL